MDGYTQAEEARALDRIWADIQVSDPDGADAARVPTYAELVEALREAERVIRWAAQEGRGRVARELVGGWLHHADKARALLARIGGGA